jgi:hypothetical protein
MQRRASNDIGASRGGRERVRESNSLAALKHQCVHLDCFDLLGLAVVERCISHRGLETAHDALAVGLSDPRGRSGLFCLIDANRVERSMCDAT